MSQNGLKITAVTVDQAAKIMTAAHRREISTEAVSEIVERFGLLRPDGTFSLLDYVAAIVEESASGSR